MVKNKLPENWKDGTFSDLAKIDMGQSPESNTYNFEKIGMPLLNGPTEFTDRYPIKVQWTSKPTKTCKAGDILICVRGSSTGRINIANEEYCIGRGVAAIRGNDKSTTKFLEYQLSSIVQQILGLSTGSTFPSVDKSTLSKISVKIPPLTEQQKIAAILGTWDEAIQSTQRLVQQLEAQKKGLMQRLLGGKVRLPGFSESWQQKTIGDLIEESRISLAQSDPDSRLTVKLNLKGVKRRGNKRVEKEEVTTYYRRTAGQFIYGKQNLHKGAMGIIPKALDGFASSQDIPAFDFKGSAYPAWFLAFMSQESFYQNLEKISTGTGSKRINPQTLYQIRINVPPIAEQTRIAEILNAAEREIKKTKSYLAALQQQKRGLMQQLLSGEVRVKI